MGIQLNQLMLSGKCVLGVIPLRDVVLESHSTCPAKEINNQSIQQHFPPEYQLPFKCYITIPLPH